MDNNQKSQSQGQEGKGKSTSRPEQITEQEELTSTTAISEVISSLP